MVGGFILPKQNATDFRDFSLNTSIKNIVIPEVLLYLS